MTDSGDRTLKAKIHSAWIEHWGKTMTFEERGESTGACERAFKAGAAFAAAPQREAAKDDAVARAISQLWPAGFGPKNLDELVVFIKEERACDAEYRATLRAPSESEAIRALTEALEPFAKAAEDIDSDLPDATGMWEHPASMSVTAGDFRRARAAPNQGGQADG